MANLCNNDLTISGPKEEKERFIVEACKSGEGILHPEDEPNPPLNIHALRLLAGDPVDESKVQCAWESTKPYFMKNGALCYFFLTKWAPPRPDFLLISTAFPKLKFTIRFNEPGCAFKGKFVCKNGKVVEDTTITY